MVVKKGGKKGKKTKKKPSIDIERELVFKDERQEYCQVTKLLGSCRLEGNCFDGKIRICKIRGSMRKKIWIKIGDIVIISLRDFEDDKADVIFLYQQKEVKKLIKLGELPENVKMIEVEADDDGNEDIGFDFRGSDDESETELDKLKEQQDSFKKNFESNFDAL